MNENRIQTLIDGHLRGSLNTSEQTEFDSRFASDPSFTEKVTGALAAHQGEAPVEFVEDVASRLDTRWEQIYNKGTRVVDKTFFLEAGMLAAALAILVGAGWYVWKTLGPATTASAQAGLNSPKVVLAFTLPSGDAASWKPKKTFADAEHDFTPRADGRLSAEKNSAVPSSLASEPPVPKVDRSSAGSVSGQILRIRVEVPRNISGRVTLWDDHGLMVRQLFNGKMPAGTWALDWDQKNDRGTLVSPGSYQVRIEAGGQILTGQVIVTPGS